MENQAKANVLGSFRNEQVAMSVNMATRFVPLVVDSPNGVLHKRNRSVNMLASSILQSLGHGRIGFLVDIGASLPQ